MVSSSSKETHASVPVRVIKESHSYTPYLGGESVSNLRQPPPTIAQSLRLRGKNSLLEMTQAPKRFYGYREKKIFPKVTYALGSSEYTGVGVARSVGSCKWKGSSAYYTQGIREQKPIFRNKDIRLQFPHFQRCVVDLKQEPPKMYGEFSMRCSSNLVL
jgi:hypothetical protein